MRSVAHRRLTGFRSAAAAVEAIALLAVTLPLALWSDYPTVWFLTPFLWITVTGRPYDAFGLTLRRLGSPLFHATVCLVVFGGYSAAYYAYARWHLGLVFAPSLPSEPLQLLAIQILIIGFPEEFFFRGYLQTQLNGWLGRPYRLLGARWGWGLPVTAILFALCHVVTGGWTRMEVVAFALVAGWLRERTSTIAVPAVYHGVANVLQATLSGSFS